MRYETTVSIDADPRRVWDALTAVESWPSWTPTVTAARRLDEGDLRVGSRTELDQPGQPTLVWTVTDLVPNESFTWTSASSGMRFAAGHRLRADGDRAVVTLEFEARGPLAFLATLAARRIRRSVDTEARLLKAHCERRPTA